MALEGRWDDAIAINRELIQRDGKDTDAYNRLGSALLAQGDTEGAYEAYSGALKSDAANLIARRNLQRMEVIRRGDAEGDKSEVDQEATPFPRLAVFLEEVGKTWVTELANPALVSFLARIYAGQQLELSIDAGRLVVSTTTGTYVGEIERKTAERLVELINGGNIYEVFALGLSPNSLRVILREVHRDPSQAEKLSFPKQITETRAYLRERDILRQLDESDFLLDEDDEGDDIPKKAAVSYDSEDDTDDHEAEADETTDEDETEDSDDSDEVAE